jgi:hypothetical protein
MAPIKSDELAKRAHARIPANPPSRVFAHSRIHRLERGLPEEALHKRDRRRMIEHEPIVSGQGQPESAQIREVGQTVA